ncbi:MAG: sugar phosphate isomerase/epimerase [Clostridia bacterium]|nr:sugar phosphate isomerase/epimerase [Clostridia bacterium]
MNTPILGIQLYTLRDFCQNAEDFDTTLSYLSSLGVTDVQISAIGPIPANIQKEILDKYEMKVCVTHKPLERFLNDTDNLIEEHKVIECDALGLGGAPEDARGTKEAVDSFIAKINSIGGKLKENGMTFNYHNHDFEFKKLDNGETMIDYLIENTDPEIFRFIPDVAWIHFAGADPVEYLNKMKGRVKVCHFKDYNIIDGERKFCTLGEGLVDLKACYNACKELDIPYIMYEQDIDWFDNDAKKATKLSWEYMNKIAK